MKVLDALSLSSFNDDTIVIFTSDHGDLLGAHGHLRQKMYCAYEEVLHVPFYIHNKHLFPQRQSFAELTSHVDLLPTMLGLAGADIPSIQNRLNSSFSEVRPFVGRDLTPYLLNYQQLGEATYTREPVYFMTDDEITRGQHQFNPLGRAYNAVIQPNHIETVIADLPGQHGRPNQTWKFTRYFDNNQFWSEPGVRDVTIQLFGEWCADSNQTTSHVTCKTVPVPEEYELYNLTEDPLETHNLAHPVWSNSQTKYVQSYLARLLDDQRSRKRLRPESFNPT